jgi:Peptidase C13 family
MPTAHPVEPPRLTAALVRNLSGGLALLALRRPPPGRFVVSFDAVMTLLALTLCTWALLDFLHSEPHAPLALDGLFGWAAYVLLALAACALLARLESRAALTRALLVPALAVAPFVLAIFWLAGDLAWVARRPLTSSAVALIYLALLSLRVLGAAFGRVRIAPALAAVIMVIASPWVIALMNLDTRLWVAEEPATAEEGDDSDEVEALFYDQPARIAAAVSRVKPAEAGATGVYFVGFAGDGDQGVFRREAQFASEVFGERLGSKERSVLLINDVDDRNSWPLASVSGLAQTLKVLAARMRPDEDVLVLFLTSHGSEDGLEVENGSLPLEQLAPDDLRQALDASAIRWRVLIVSACYAGVFLDELKSDTSAIITAADATHSSFGCEDDRNLTWFGEAFLKDALPGSATLQEAFHKAAALIARREGAAHEVHSNPQLYVGPLMQRKLMQLPLRERSPADHSAYTVHR